MPWKNCGVIQSIIRMLHVATSLKEQTPPSEQNTKKCDKTVNHQHIYSLEERKKSMPNMHTRFHSYTKAQESGYE